MEPSLLGEIQMQVVKRILLAFCSLCQVQWASLAGGCLTSSAKHEQISLNYDTISSTSDLIGREEKDFRSVSLLRF
jgi:hypothetical protein